MGGRSPKERVKEKKNHYIELQDCHKLKQMCDVLSIFSYFCNNLFHSNIKQIEQTSGYTLTDTVNYYERLISISAG